MSGVRVRECRGWGEEEGRTGLEGFWGEARVAPRVVRVHCSPTGVNHKVKGSVKAHCSFMP